MCTQLSFEACIDKASVAAQQAVQRDDVSSTVAVTKVQLHQCNAYLLQRCSQCWHSYSACLQHS
eukprot:12300-Heterococcus_DN1.PRE.2